MKSSAVLTIFSSLLLVSASPVPPPSRAHPCGLSNEGQVKCARAAPSITANLKKHKKPGPEFEALDPAPSVKGAWYAGFPEGVDIPFEPERETWVDEKTREGEAKVKREESSTLGTSVTSGVGETETMTAEKTEKEGVATKVPWPPEASWR